MAVEPLILVCTVRFVPSGARSGNAVVEFKPLLLNAMLLNALIVVMFPTVLSLVDDLLDVLKLTPV